MPASADRPGSRESSAEEFDLVVVGAGPAGAALALRAARQGVTTLLVDRATFPRDKVCGSCLHPRALAELERLDAGVDAATLGAIPLERARIGARGAWAELPVSGAAVVSRRRLDAALVDAARSAGATVRTGTVARLVDADGDLRAVALEPAGGAEPDSTEPLADLVHARVVAAADGLGAPLLARRGEVEAPPAPGARVGLGATVDVAGGPPAGRVDLAVARDGYLGLARLEDGRLDLAAAIDPRALRGVRPGDVVQRIAAECGVELPALDGAHWSGTPALTRRAPRPWGRRALAVGDAAGYVEPFTGEGIAWALAGARVTAEHLRGLVDGWGDGGAGAWARALDAELRTRRRRCALVASFVRRPAWVAAAAPILRRSRVLAAVAARVGYGRQPR